MSSRDAEWVAVALLGKPRGNRGEVTALPLSSKPERFEALKNVHLYHPGNGTTEPAVVDNTWFHSGTLIFKFHGIDTISDAERLAGAEVRLPVSERAVLPEGEFYESDIVGCEVIDRRSGDALGKVTALQDAGGPGLLVVEGQLLIPFARAICVHIDPANRRIEVELPEGLKDLNRS